jgi:hypothetical protein
LDVNELGLVDFTNRDLFNSDSVIQTMRSERQKIHGQRTHRNKTGTLESGKGGKVENRKQAIAIGLSEAREKGAKVPNKKS